jgi:hypothetical protein
MTHTCIESWLTHGAGSGPVTVLAADGDGDPLRLTFTSDGCSEISPPALDCVGGSCGATGYTCAPPPACGVVSGGNVSATATDGMDAAAATLIFDVGCP